MSTPVTPRRLRQGYNPRRVAGIPSIPSPPRSPRGSDAAASVSQGTCPGRPGHHRGRWTLTRPASRVNPPRGGALARRLQPPRIDPTGGLGSSRRRRPFLFSEEGRKGKIISRQRPTLPHTNACSTIGAEGLNCRVRNGNGCFPLATATGKTCDLKERLSSDNESG